MKISESINRGFNLLTVSITGLAGFAFGPEIFLEKDWDDKVDDIALFVFGIFGIIWYLLGNNKFKRSITPVVIMVLTMIVKISGLIREFHDKDAAGDDFGGVILFILATGLVLYQYWQTKRLLQENNS